MFFCFATLNVYSYTENLVNTSSYAGTLGAGKSVSSQRTGISQNPAGFKNKLWGLALHTYKPFSIKDIRVNELSFFHDKGLGKSFNLFSTVIDKLYQDYTFEIQISKKIPYNIYIGGSVIFSYVRIYSVGKQTLTSSSIGVIYSPWKWIDIGVYTQHLISQSKIKTQLKNPLFLGFSLYSYERKVSLYFDFFKDPIRKEWRSTFGQTFSILSFSEVSIGIEPKPLQISFQILVAFKNFKLGKTHSFHQELGTSNHYHLNGNFKIKQK